MVYDICTTTTSNTLRALDLLEGNMGTLWIDFYLLRRLDCCSTISSVEHDFLDVNKLEVAYVTTVMRASKAVADVIGGFSG